MVYIKGYFNFNLGDDLFLKILTERYSNLNFLAMSLANYDNQFKNVKFIKREKINKLVRILTLNNDTYENHIMKKQDFTILIGGSMFMEKSFNSKNKYFVGGGKSYFILGSNFGPYRTEDYYKKFYKIFSEAEDVCFRDKYSYELYKDLPNVRMAPDIIFSLDTSNLKINSDNKNVVISVIDCSNKIDNKDIYENKIVQLIKLFSNKDYNITLMSFCKSQGDEKAIQSIMAKISDKELKSKILRYFYRGNINEALEVIAQSQIVVGSRFHANILGLIMNKTIIPIAYSDKTLNVLNDLDFKGRIFDIRDMEKFDVNFLTDQDLNYKLDVSAQKKEAEKHFEKLDSKIPKFN